MLVSVTHTHTHTHIDGTKEAGTYLMRVWKSGVSVCPSGNFEN